MHAHILLKRVATALRGRHRLRVTYHGGTRIVEPYLIYQTQSGDLLLHAWQVSGDYRASPPPDWCNLRLAEISTAAVLPERFDRPHPQYNPESPLFHRVLLKL